MAQAEADEDGSQTQLTSAEKRELAQLRRDKRRLEMETVIWGRGTRVGQVDDTRVGVLGAVSRTGYLPRP